MTIFGITGFLIFANPILAIVGGVFGLGVGRMIGSNMKTRLQHQSLDQGILFEMELVIKWAKKQRK